MSLRVVEPDELKTIRAARTASDCGRLRHKYEKVGKTNNGHYAIGVCACGLTKFSFLGFEEVYAF